jgi:biopolymer transport protein TolR
MAMSVGGPKGGPKADINITPLVDVVLVLLIIFMVVTPMMQKGIEVKLPIGKHVIQGKEQSPLIITVTAADQVYLDKTPVADDKLTEEVKKEIEMLPNRTVLLKGDKSLKWVSMRKRLDLIRKAQEGVKSTSPGVSLATEKEAGAAEPAGDPEAKP